MASELTRPEEIEALVRRSRRIAVLGMKTEEQAGQPAFYVAEYLATRPGLEVIPVPVYYPDVTRILGRQVFRKLVDVPGEIDLVDVFRLPAALDGHLEDLLAKKPKAVWLQLGIRNDAFAAKLIAAGIDVVQDKCLLVEHRRYAD